MATRKIITPRAAWSTGKPSFEEEAARNKAIRTLENTSIAMLEAIEKGLVRTSLSARTFPEEKTKLASQTTAQLKRRLQASIHNMKHDFEDPSPAAAYDAFVKTDPVAPRVTFGTSRSITAASQRKQASVATSSKSLSVKRETDAMYDDELYRPRSPRPTSSKKGKERAISEDISDSSRDRGVLLPSSPSKRKKKRRSSSSNMG
jgi:hypothetical protein